MARSISVVCTAICLGGIIAAIVTGVVFLIHGKYEIGYPHHLWYWCVIYGGILAFALLNMLIKLWFPREEVEAVEDSTTSNRAKRYAKSYVYDYENPMDSIIRLAEFAMFIWGCVIYAYIGMNGYPYDDNLWTWFQVMFWFLVAWMCIVFCLFCCLGCAACLTCLMVSIDGSTDHRGTAIPASTMTAATV